jgi:hypothetical protein
LVRDYHPFDWDVGESAANATSFPFARNRVDWDAVYGSWKQEGYDVDVSIMFDNFKRSNWKDLNADARRYGKAFAAAFGPSSRRPLVSTVEVGNEPGKYSDADYRAIFEGMAQGLREGDPKIKIATCAVSMGKSNDYAKSVDCFKGLEPLIDVLNIHVYAFAEQWPTWRRSYPEDPSIAYLKEVRSALEWRDKNLPGKEVWLTEFGWDASTKPAPKSGTFAKWKGNTDVEQAQWLARSALLFHRIGLERAYIYFFNDYDEPQLHGSSGLTRRFQPKPAIYALSHMQRSLGDARFARVIRESADATVYEYLGEDAHRPIWVCWSPTGLGKSSAIRLPLEGRRVLKAERMPLTAGEPSPENTVTKEGALELKATESPLYVWLAIDR